MGSGQTLRLPDGEIIELKPGWNSLPNGGRAYLRRDDVVVYRAPEQQLTAAGETGSAEVTLATPSVGALYPDRRHPDFEPGNTAAQRHGAQSPRRVEPLASELIETAIEHAAFLREPSFRPALDAWARAEARCALLALYLDEHGLLDEKGEPRGATRLMNQVEAHAARMRQSLGLDAASRAGIESSLTSTAISRAALDAALAAGQQALRDRLARSTSEAAS